MNYYFGILLCVIFMIIKILYERFYYKKNKIEIKNYLQESVLLFISYCILIHLLIYFELYNNLNLIGDDLNIKSNTVKDSGSAMIFTNEPNF